MKGPRVIRKGSFFFYILLSIVVFFPCLILGKIYFHDDLFLQYGFFRQFLRDQLSGGHFPLWDPYLFGGQPFFADPNTMAAYPLLYPTLLFPIGYGLSVFFFLHLAIAALGVHFLLNSFRFSDASCRIGAVTFALSGFFWSEIVHPPILAAFSWLPWFIAFLERTIRERRLVPAFGSGLAYAFLFLSGNYQMSLTAFYGGILYFSLRLFMEKEKSTPRGKKQWIPLAGAFLWGAFLLFLWLAPSLEFIEASSRFHAPADYAGFNASFALEPSTWFQFLFPRNPMGPTLLPYPDFIDNIGFLGLWAPFLIFSAFLSRGPGRSTFLVLSLSAFLLAWGAHLPFHRWACDWLPGLNQTRVPSRFLCLYSLGGAFLAAFGFEKMNFSYSAQARRQRLGRLAYLLFLSAAVLWKFHSQWAQAFSLGIGFLGIGWEYKSRRPSPWTSRIFQGSILLSLVINGWTVVSTGPASNLYFPPGASWVQSTQKEIGPDRVLISDHIPYSVRSGENVYTVKFPLDSVCALGIPSATGYNPMRLRTFAEIQALPFETFVRLMAVQGFLLAKGERADFGVPEWTWGPFQFERTRENLPRVWPAGQVQEAPDAARELEAMGRPDFNPFQQTVLSEPLDLPARALGNVSPQSLRWENVKNQPDEEIWNLSLDRPDLVVFSEVMYPGWKAWVDNAPAPILRADHLLRALRIPAGDHEIRFGYRPWWFFPLLLLGALWLISLVPAWFFLGRPGKSTKKLFLG